MKLTIELVPKTCFYKNVRQIVSATQWNKIRKQIYIKYNYKCSICYEVGDKHPVEAHEVWEYNDKKSIQILKDIVALCPSCHMSVHYGLAQLHGFGTKARNHLSKINSITKKEADVYIENCFKIWQKRSQKHWQLDITYLENYGIDISSIKPK